MPIALEQVQTGFNGSSTTTLSPSNLSPEPPTGDCVIVAGSQYWVGSGSTFVVTTPAGFTQDLYENATTAIGGHLSHKLWVNGPDGVGITQTSGASRPQSVIALHYSGLKSSTDPFDKGFTKPFITATNITAELNGADTVAEDGSLAVAVFFVRSLAETRVPAYNNADSGWTEAAKVQSSLASDAELYIATKIVNAGDTPQCGFSHDGGSSQITCGMAIFTPVAVVATIPDAPTIITTPYSPEAITIDITTVDDGGAAITDTHIEHRETLVGGAWTRNSTGDEAATYTIRGLTPGTQYDVRVFQENSVGESLASITATPTVPQQATQADLSMMDWAEPFFFSLPPFGTGTFTSADAQQILGFPGRVAMLAIVGFGAVSSVTLQRQLVVGTGVAFDHVALASDQSRNALTQAAGLAAAAWQSQTGVIDLTVLAGLAAALQQGQGATVEIQTADAFAVQTGQQQAAALLLQLHAAFLAAPGLQSGALLNAVGVMALASGAGFVPFPALTLSTVGSFSADLAAGWTSTIATGVVNAMAALSSQVGQVSDGVLSIGGVVAQPIVAHLSPSAQAGINRALLLGCSAAHVQAGGILHELIVQMGGMMATSVETQAAIAGTLALGAQQAITAQTTNLATALLALGCTADQIHLGSRLVEAVLAISLRGAFLAVANNAPATIGNVAVIVAESFTVPTVTDESVL